VATASTVQNRKNVRESGRGTNPPRAGVAESAVRAAGGQAKQSERAAGRQAVSAAGAGRRNAQLPGFAPLLEELEIAGWSSHRKLLGGNFHDWMLLDGRGVLVMVGQAVGTAAGDSIESALVAQAAWSAVRAHALHTRDAGMLLSLASRSLWPAPNAGATAAVAIALIDNAEGHGSLAMAGDCLAWTVRAATTEQIATCQPPLGAAGDFTYRSQPVQLSLRERLVLVADDPQRRDAKLPIAVEASFAQLDAESHRRMVAADAVALVRPHFEAGAEDSHGPASIVAVRRR
jgi:Stage II sporulation protein E (SpoIIE)